MEVFFRVFYSDIAPIGIQGEIPLTGTYLTGREVSGQAYWEIDREFDETNDYFLDNRMKRINFAKGNNTFRIVGIGDSITFGSNLNDNDTYLKKLEYILNTEFLDDNLTFETVNFGLSGYSIIQDKITLERKAIKTNPDLILLQLFENDFSLQKLVRKGAPYAVEENVEVIEYEGEVIPLAIPFPDELNDFLIDNSYFYRKLNILIQNILDKIKESKQMKTTDLGVKQNIDALLEIKKISDQNGLKLLVVIFPGTSGDFKNYPSTQKQFHNIIADVAEKNDILLLDLLDVFKSYDYKKIRLDDRGHLNAIGNEITARAIRDKLISENLIPSR
jgi:lysophospholipase L1-like esterase